MANKNPYKVKATFTKIFHSGPNKDKIIHESLTFNSMRDSENWFKNINSFCSQNVLDYGIFDYQTDLVKI